MINIELSSGQYPAAAELELVHDGIKDRTTSGLKLRRRPTPSVWPTTQTLLAPSQGNHQWIKLPNVEGDWADELPPTHQLGSPTPFENASHP